MENRPKPDPNVPENHREILELIHKQKNATVLVNFKGGQIAGIEVHPAEAGKIPENKEDTGINESDT